MPAEVPKSTIISLKKNGEVPFRTETFNPNDPGMSFKKNIKNPMTWVYDVETTINPYDKKNRGLGRGRFLRILYIYIYPANKYHIPQKKARLKMIFLRQKFTRPTPTPKNHSLPGAPSMLLSYWIRVSRHVQSARRPGLGRIIPVSE